MTAHNRPLDENALAHTINMMPWRTDDIGPKLREFAYQLWLQFCSVQAAATAPASSQDEPFGYFRADAMGWTDCAADDEGAVALYEAPPDVAILRKELESANDFIKSLADVCQKYEELLGYRKTNAPEGASELAEAKGESSLNTELDLACANSTCQHNFALDPKSSIRICLKCGTPERRAMKTAATSQPVTLTDDEARAIYARTMLSLLEETEGCIGGPDVVALEMPTRFARAIIAALRAKGALR